MSINPIPFRKGIISNRINTVEDKINSSSNTNNNNNHNNNNNNSNNPQMNSLRPIDRTKSSSTKGNRYNNYETSSSILSDYEEVDVVDIEESLYVLFNPLRPTTTRNTSDILSLTNTATRTYSSDLEAGEDEQDEDDDDIPVECQLSEASAPEDDSRDVYFSAQQDNLSNKINSWYNSNNNALLHSHLLMDENVASWNLDETVMTSRSSTRLMVITEEEALKMLLKQFYGDELFQYLNKEEVAKVKKFHKLIDIKRYLLDKNESNSSSLLSQLLYKVLMLNNKNDTPIGFKRFPKVNSPRCAAAGATDYINYLQRIPRDVQNNGIAQQEIAVEPITFSETTNSSGIACGGYGSWSDVG